MPEGDTIFRAARTLRQALAGRAVTAARSTVPQVVARNPGRLVGQTVAAVESRGKHLLVWFAPSELALHTHMRMTGSWHLYAPGEPWRKPARMARVVLEVPGWTAVCFNAPVVALLGRGEVEVHPSLAALGPDALDDDVDVDEAERRLAARPGWTIAEALLDQRVLAGVGNVYKCELLFLHRLDPWARVGDVHPATRRALLDDAVRLLRANVAPGTTGRITTVDSGAGAGGDAVYVYGKHRRPCPRCGTPIERAAQGEQARLTFWCPRCQGPGPARRPRR